MKQLIPYAIILVIAVTLLGGNATGLLGVFLLIEILYAAFHIIFKNKLPKDFWVNIALLLFVPTIILSLIAGLAANINAWKPTDEQAFILVILFGFILYGWSAWQRHRSGKKPQDSNQLKHSERKFISSYSDSSDN